MYERVLVPLDGSVVAEAIIPFILQIAGPLDFEVVLLRALPPVPSEVVREPALAEKLESQHADAEEYLAGVKAELLAKGLRARTVLRHGDPVTEIAAGAAAERADLIAMTTHGRSGLRRVLFGSVAEGVLRQTAIPVLLMRQTEAEVARRAAQTGRGPS
jgi:nucleotide-binding universal stress UspA family protein